MRVVRIGGWAGRATGRQVGRPGGGGVERASAVRVVQGVERLVGGALGRGWWGGGQGSSPAFLRRAPDSGSEPKSTPQGEKCFGVCDGHVSRGGAIAPRVAGL